MADIINSLLYMSENCTLNSIDIVCEWGNLPCGFVISNLELGDGASYKVVYSSMLANNPEGFKIFDQEGNLIFVQEFIGWKGIDLELVKQIVQMTEKIISETQSITCAIKSELYINSQLILTY